ncbi:ankyrin repeat-containing domain protein, partial [Coprinopsis sp. MPI-PUGE-AT-0042]
LLSLPGILVNVADKCGDIPLIYAARWSQKASLSQLLAHPKINVNAANSYRRTALMSASSEEQVLLLLAHPKIEPNLFDFYGDTALMYASRSGYLEIVQALLADPRVQVNLKSKQGKTALDLAEE